MFLYTTERYLILFKKGVYMRKRISITDVFRLLLDRFGPQHWWPGDTEFEIIVGAVLTQNTNWANVEKAITNLKTHGYLDPIRLYRARKGTVARLIRSAGYYNQKAERLKTVTRWYLQLDRSKPTEVLREELLNIKGVGPETADSILLYALHRPVFVIDAYTRRMCERHGVSFKSYEEYREWFEKAFSQLTDDEKVYVFNEFHALIVKLGKTYCKRNKPRCDECPLHGFMLRNTEL